MRQPRVPATASKLLPQLPERFRPRWPRRSLPSLLRPVHRLLAVQRRQRQLMQPLLPLLGPQLLGLLPRPQPARRVLRAPPPSRASRHCPVWGASCLHRPPRPLCCHGCCVLASHPQSLGPPRKCNLQLPHGGLLPVFLLLPKLGNSFQCDFQLATQRPCGRPGVSNASNRGLRGCEWPLNLEHTMHVPRPRGRRKCRPRSACPSR